MGVAPGATLKAELLARGIKQKDFASAIGMQTTHFCEIVNGKRAITPAIADKLEIELGIPAKFWVRLQAEYEYECDVLKNRSKEEAEAQYLLSQYEQKVDVKLLLRRINSSASTFSQKLAVLRDEFALSDPAELNMDYGLYHRSNKVGKDERALLTWTILARRSVLRQQVRQRYCREDETVLQQLKEVFNNNSGNVLQQVSDILSNNGIRFCVEKKIPNASVDGYSFVADDGIPCIVVSMRFNRIDNLAFAVIHEIGHLKLHVDSMHRSFLNTAEDSREENEANRYASAVLVPDVLWRHRPRVAVNIRNIQLEYGRWAEQNGINKWIVLGRIAHETGMYKFTQDGSRAVAGYCCHDSKGRLS